MENIISNTIKSKPICTFRFNNNQNQEESFTVRGHVAETIAALVESNAEGVTAFDVPKSWALQLPVYISIFRRIYHLDILTIRQTNTNGLARYILKTPVVIPWRNF